MDLFRQNLRLDLVRPNLNGLPAATLPPGYSWRWFQPGDAAHWLHIHHDAEPFHDICPELFTRQFGGDFAKLGQRQLFVQDEIGRVVGTCTAWEDVARPEGPCGRVFWLAVLRQFQGRGLGRALLTATCARLAELGYTRACVVTSTGRLPAVKLYLHSGFEPEMQSAAERIVWDRVFEAIQAHGAASTVAAA